MTERVGRVVVFGATSYLGRFVLDALLARNLSVVAITRNPATASILLGGVARRIKACTDAQLAGERADAVLNLAYVKQAVPVGIVRQNHALMSAVARVARETGASVVLHVSSANVFGYRFNRVPTPGPAPRVTGDSYVELKGQAERTTLALASRGDYLPVIVRPGNILGPASPTWVVAPVQRLLDGRPVAIEGLDGFANATYAPNLADYLALLAITPVARLAAFGPYHHVAEFSSERWSTFFRAFADTVGVQPVLAGDPAAERSGAPLASRVAARLTDAYRGLLGVWTRRTLGRIPADPLGHWMYFRLKTRLAGRSLANAPSLDAADLKYLTIVSTPWEFRSHTLADWRPPASLEDAIADIRASLQADGFPVQSRPQ